MTGFWSERGEEDAEAPVAHAGAAIPSRATFQMGQQVVGLIGVRKICCIFCCSCWPGGVCAACGGGGGGGGFLKRSRLSCRPPPPPPAGPPSAPPAPGNTPRRS